MIVAIPPGPAPSEMNFIEILEWGATSELI